MGWMEVLKTIGMIALPGGVQDPRGIGHEGIAGQWIPGIPKDPYRSDLGGSRDMMYKFGRDDVHTGGDPLSGIPLDGQYAHQPEDPYANLSAEPFADSAKAPYISPETAPYRPATADVQVPQDYGRSQETPFAKVQLNKAVQDYYNVRNNPPQKLSRGKAALAGLALAGMDMQGSMGQRNLDDKQAFGMAVGDALSRVIGGLVAPKATARQVQNVREDKALQDLSRSQEIYNQDVAGRYKEEQIDYAGARQDKTAAEIQRMKEDAIRKDEQLKVAQRKADILQGESIRNAWSKTTKFNKAENPDDLAISNQYQKIIGVPLPDKDGDIMDFDIKSIGGKLYMVEQRKSGIKQGFRDAAGNIVSQNDALDYEDIRETVAKTSAGASMYRTDSEKETNFARIKSALEIAKNKLGFDKEEFKIKIKAAEAADQIPAGSSESLLSGLE